MRPQVDDTTAEVIERLADEVTDIDVTMLTFDQQLRVVLQNVDSINATSRQGAVGTTTDVGRAIEQLS